MESNGVVEHVPKQLERSDAIVGKKTLPEKRPMYCEEDYESSSLDSRGDDSAEKVVLPADPDVLWFLMHFSLTAKEKVDILRKSANALCAINPDASKRQKKKK